MYINISKVTGVKQQYYTTFSEAHSAIDIVISILEHEKQTTDVEFNKSLDIQKLAQNSRKQKINDVFKKKKSKNCYVCSLNIKQNLKSELLFVIVLIVFISTYDIPIPRYINAKICLEQKLAIYRGRTVYLCRLRGSGELIDLKQF